VAAAEPGHRPPADDVLLRHCVEVVSSVGVSSRGIKLGLRGTAIRGHRRPTTEQDGKGTSGGLGRTVKCKLR
jgi:hypothetical protein